MLCKDLAVPPILEVQHPKTPNELPNSSRACLRNFRSPMTQARPVAMSQIITPMAHGAIALTPMHLAKAPQLGRGKPYRAEVASNLATGERCTVIAVGPNPKATRKRLIRAALAVDPTRRPQQRQQPRHSGLRLPSDPLDDRWQKALVR